MLNSQQRLHVRSVTASVLLLHLDSERDRFGAAQHMSGDNLRGSLTTVPASIMLWRLLSCRCWCMHARFALATFVLTVACQLMPLVKTDWTGM